MGKYDDIINMLEQTLINAEEAVNEIEAASRNISFPTGSVPRKSLSLFMSNNLLCDK